MLELFRACHRLLISARRRDDAAREMCRLLASALRSRFVWLGVADDRHNVLHPLGYFGDDGGYLDSGAWRGGLEATALAERRTLAHDELGDAHSAWRAQLLASGFTSAIAVPLGGERPFGVLALLDAGTDHDKAERRMLLQHLAEDIGHGLHALHQHEERERLFALVDDAPDAVAAMNPAGVITYCNAEAVQLFGADSAEGLFGRRLSAFQPSWAAAKVSAEALPTALSHGFWQSESAVLHSDGSEIPVVQTLLGHKHPDGCFVSAVFQDIRRGRRECARKYRSELVHDYLIAASTCRRTAPPAYRESGKLPVAQAQRTLMLDMGAVAYLRADGHYTHVHTAREAHLSGQPLSQVEKLLDEARFLRTHRSYIVNIDFILAVERTDKQLEVVLNTRLRDRIPISRRNADSVRQALGLS